MIQNFVNKVAVVTGGTGSFGETVSKHLLSSGISELRVFSRDEAKQDRMRRSIRDSRVNFILGDVRDENSLADAMRGVNYVFHAAALKQVPSAEFFPLEAVKTNILGSSNVLNASVEAGVESVVMLSTDKAVYPVNAMGISKALMEKVAIAKARTTISETRISITRYGNVMMSRGSVIPLFVEQGQSGKPLTITNPEMTRFLMSLEESVDLVMHAFNSQDNGATFIKKSPSCTIADLATAISELFDFTAGVEIIGTRHGEKLFETLLSEEELPIATDEGEYFRVPMDVRDLNYDLYFAEGASGNLEGASYNSHNSDRLNVSQIKEKLLSLPELRSLLEGR